MAKRYLFWILLSAVCGSAFQSCQKGGLTEGGKEEEEDKTYILPRPEISISNPYPCIDEPVVLSFVTEGDVTASWEFGDGTSSTERNVQHIYTEDGAYSVNLQLSDGKGGTVTVDTSITVMGKRLDDALAELASKPSTIWVCAHRAQTYYGKRIGDIPENSIEAIQRAFEAGAEMVEIDVRTTADGELVLMHDETIDRMTNGSGPVGEISLAMLKRLNLKDSDGNLTSNRVPTLAEALVAGRGKVYFDLDLKDIDPAAVVKVVDSVHMLDRVAFYRGSSKALAKEVTDVNAECIVFPYVKRTAVIDYWSENARIKMVQLDYNNELTAGPIVLAAKEKGLVSFANYLNAPGEGVVNGDHSVLERILQLQFQIIQTDYTEFVNAYLGK